MEVGTLRKPAVWFAVGLAVLVSLVLGSQPVSAEVQRLEVVKEFDLSFHPYGLA